MTPSQRAELARLLAANRYEGTRLPWKEADYWSNGGGVPTSGFYIPGHNDGKQVEMMTVDANLIVAAVNALPQLLADSEELERVKADAQTMGRVIKSNGDVPLDPDAARTAWMNALRLAEVYDPTQCCDERILDGAK